MFGEISSKSGGVAKKKEQKMEVDAQRVQPGRVAKVVAPKNIEMKRERRPKGRDVNQALTVDLQEMVEVMVPQVKTYKPPRVIPNPSRRVSPKYPVDLKTYREPRQIDFTPRFVLETRASQEMEKEPSRMAREEYYEANRLAKKLEETHIPTQPKKLVRKALKEHIVILDELKEAVIEPIILLNPHKNHLEILHKILSVTEVINKNSLIEVNHELKRMGIKKEYVQELQRLMTVLEDEYDMDHTTDLIGMYNDYKERIQGLFKREKHYLMSLLYKINGWRLQQMGKVGQEESTYPVLPSADQRKRHQHVMSQYQDSYKIYGNYENQCLALVEKVEADEEKFMTEKIIDIYENTKKQSIYNLFEAQELFRVLGEILTKLNQLYTTVDEMKKNKADMVAETKDALDDIMALFSTGIHLGGKKKKIYKTFSKKNKSSK